jgi:hypothetical protein
MVIRVGRKRPTPAQGSSFSQAVRSDISLILDCSYLHRNIADEENSLFRPGFPELGEHADMRDGFNLNYAEITFYSVVDPYFELFAICHLSPEHTHLEEAYWLTKRLPGGLQLKAGKFLSSFGRINELHTHYWDFADRPLVHQALFGAEGLNEIGARVTWVAPLETYVMAGGELLMGDNETSFGRMGFTAAEHPRQQCQRPCPLRGISRMSIDIGDASVLGRFSGRMQSAKR